MKRILSILVLTAASATVLTGCTDPAPTSQKQGQKQTEQAFKQQSTAVPYPADQLKDSLERRNLREHLLRNNRANAINYLYILSFGKPLGYYTIKGKVSSTQSQMTTSTLMVNQECSGCPDVPIAGPSDDGSYGLNENGVFFFTTEGAMVTTSLDYLVSDQPVAFNVPKLNGDTKVANTDTSQK